MPKIVSQVGTDLDTVVDAVLETALETCEAEFGITFDYQGESRFRELQSLNICRDLRNCFRLRLEFSA